MASACLFLAAKVEEQPRKLEHVLKILHICVNRDAQAQFDTKSEVRSYCETNTAPAAKCFVLVFSSHWHFLQAVQQSVFCIKKIGLTPQILPRRHEHQNAATVTTLTGNWELNCIHTCFFITWILTILCSALLYAMKCKYSPRVNLAFLLYSEHLRFV